MLKYRKSKVLIKLRNDGIKLSKLVKRPVKVGLRFEKFYSDYV